MNSERCIIESCVGSENRDLFCSPSDKKLLKRWQQIVGTKKVEFIICSSHFDLRSIVVEKTLEENAIPSLYLDKNHLRLLTNNCGSCTKPLKNENYRSFRDAKEAYKQIIDYELLTDSLCEKCYDFLQSFIQFKKEIKQKLLNIQTIVRKQEKIEILSSDDEDDNDEEDDRKNSTLTKKLPYCRHCNYKCQSENDMVRHLKRRHNFSCDLCTFFCSSSQVLRQHFNGVHAKASKEFQLLTCHTCNEDFTSLAAINTHMLRKHSKNFYSCFYCKTNCLTDADLKVHFKIFHPNNKEIKARLESTNPQKIVIHGESEKHIVFPAGIPSQEANFAKQNVKQHSYQTRPKKVNNKIDLIARIKGSSTKKLCQKPIEEITLVEKKNNDNLMEEESIEDSSSSSSEDENDNSAPICLDSDEEIKDEPEEKVSIQIQNSENIFVEEMPVIESNNPGISKISQVKKNSPKTEATSLSSDKDEEEDYWLEDPKFIIKLPTTPPPRHVVDRAKMELPEGVAGKVRCFDCNKFMTVQELLTHREKVHLSETPKQFYEEFDMSTLPPGPQRPPRKQKLLSDKVICEHCFLKVSECNLERHVKACHTDAPKQFLCHLCSAEFSNNTNFKYHMMRHEPETQFQCDLCGKGYITKNLLSKHVRQVHCRIARDTCKICQQKMFKTNLIHRHMKLYHPNGKDDGYRVNSESNYFDCEKCGASYYDLFTFTRHSCEKGRFQSRCTSCMLPCSKDKLEKHLEEKCPKNQKTGFMRKRYA